jgi:transposase
MLSSRERSATSSSNTLPHSHPRRTTLAQGAGHAQQLTSGIRGERELGQRGLEICQELFWTWEIYQHTGDRRELKRRVGVLQRQLKPLLREHAGSGARYRYGRRFARNLLKVWPALWTFAKRPGVEPTNNHAERALRGAVIYRKLSLGSQSSDGGRRVERLLSAHTTCRLQRRSLHAYLIDLLTAHARSDPVPLLT